MHQLLDHPRDTCTYIVSGSDTFRLGCRMLFATKKKGIIGTNIGGNRQNLEKSTRIIWEADDGYLLCQPDQAGAEALIVAHLCEAGKYRSLFDNNIKPHTYLALKLFKSVWLKSFSESEINEIALTPIELLKNNKNWKDLSKLISDSDDWEPIRRYYHFAKKTIHAGSYGMRANRFRMVMLQESGGLINLSNEEAESFLMGFHKEFPEIQKWHVEIYHHVKKYKQLRNLFNFPYNITSYIDQNDYKDLIAWVPQSTVACITRYAFVRLQEYITQENKNWHLLHDCHDSYLAEAPECEIMELAKNMNNLLEVELISPKDGTKFRMKSGTAIGKNYGPYHELLNPKGMKKL